MDNELTETMDGAIEVEQIQSGTDHIGAIVWRKGYYFYIPTDETKLAISLPVMKKITARLELLTETKPIPYE